MPSLVWTVTFDCADPYALAEFWAEAVGASVAAGSRPGEDQVRIGATGGRPGFLFLRVPESKIAKNRIHLDLRPTGGAALDSEVERLTGIGATFLADFRTPEGTGFVVLADPEGNEFCVERGDPEPTQ